MSHYKTLGVQENATDGEIKKAYKKLAMQHHPDKGGDAELFKKISNLTAFTQNDNCSKTSHSFVSW